MNGKLIKRSETIYHLHVNEMLYAMNMEYDPYSGMSRIQKLSLKNIQTIERGYDLDELAEEYSTMSIFIDSRATEPPTIKEIEDAEYISEIAFKIGFQKALEILGDKKFSEDDMINCFYEGKDGDWGSAGGYVESLQQTEWDVVIEMEYVGKIKTGKYHEMNPKLDADGCLILKRISEKSST